MGDFVLLLKQNCSEKDAWGTCLSSSVLSDKLQELSGGSPNVQTWVQGAARLGAGDQRDSFADISDLLRRSLIGRDGLTVFVGDRISARGLDPLQNSNWEGLIAMLILAFPEVRWRFLQFDDACEVQATFPHILEYSIDLSWGVENQVSSPLFDGFGLRQWVIRTMTLALREELKLKEPVGSLPARQEMLLARLNDEQDEEVNYEIFSPQRPYSAVVLDEERSYSHFEALMAYSRGFRVHAVESWDEAIHLLGKDGVIGTDCLLSIEDWYLSFRDQSASGNQSVRGMSQLSKRGTVLTKLRVSLDGSEEGSAPHSGIPIRRFITVEHDRSGNRKRRKAWQLLKAWLHLPRSYDAPLDQAHSLEILRREEEPLLGKKLERKHQVVCKPASGQYTLWRDLGLQDRFRNPWGDLGKGEIRSVAPAYHWPPPYNFDAMTGEHSTAGRLLQIAESLLERASRLSEEATTVTDCVRGAVLSTQALEMLGCKTPTLSLHALCLKHEFEVKAECSFRGVEYHLALGDRRTDVRFVLSEIAKWLSSERKKDFMLNGEAQILNRLVTVFEAHGEFEEAEECRVQLRNLSLQIETRTALRRGEFLQQLIIRPIRWYSDWVLRSLAHFFGMSLLLLAIFTSCFALCQLDWGPPRWGLLDWGLLTLRQLDWRGAFHLAFESFVTVNLPEQQEGLGPGSQLVSYLAAGTGILNIGLLVSYLYSRMSRK